MTLSTLAARIWASSKKCRHCGIPIDAGLFCDSFCSYGYFEELKHADCNNGNMCADCTAEILEDQRYQNESDDRDPTIFTNQSN